MKKIIQASILSVAVLFSNAASSFTTGYTSTYVNLGWIFAAPGTIFSSCNQIAADAVGDLTTSSKVVVYGTLNCASFGGLPITGVAYFGTDGTFNLTLNVATLATITCPRLSRLTGPCTILSSSGASLGSGSVVLF